MLKKFFQIKLTRAIMMLFDALIIVGSFFLTVWYLNWAGIIKKAYTVNNFLILVIFTLLSVVSLILFNAYKGKWREAKLSELTTVICAMVVSLVLELIIGYIAQFQPLETVSCMTFIVSTFLIITTRTLYSYLYFRTRYHAMAANGVPVMIVGAGGAGKLLVNELMRKENEDYYPIIFVDNDPNKIGMSIEGCKVYGPTVLIPELCEKFGIEKIWIAIPSASQEIISRLTAVCDQTECEINVLPSISIMKYGKPLMEQTKKLNPADLLGRKEIIFTDNTTRDFIQGKVCMVTGGGGSIGSEICRQIASFDPEKLVILDIYENNAYDIEQELRRKLPYVNLVAEIASVRDYDKMHEIFEKHHPELVFHAAAHKHVPLMENAPEEAVKNNVFGTLNVVNLCEEFGVQKMVFISTDKAVNPTNVMGTTKRCCEMVIQNKAQHSKTTEFVAVRFGNVLGSNGSVIPLFKEQIKSGGPVTVTHPEIIRFFMTIPEATSLVLRSAVMAHGGEIFVLDMGEPVKILTLAENMIKFYGYTPYEDIKIEFTGLRPGEKMYEELLMGEEGLTQTSHDKIFIGSPIKDFGEDFLSQLDELHRVALTNDSAAVVAMLHKVVPTFHEPESEEKQASAKKAY